MEEKRIYSINLATWIIHKGYVNYRVEKDNSNSNVYVVFDGDVSKLIEEYKKNENLHSYLSCFRNLKLQINKIKYAE